MRLSSRTSPRPSSSTQPTGSSTSDAPPPGETAVHPAAQDAAEPDFITIRVPRGLFYAGIGVMAGLLVGFLLGRATAGDPGRDTAVTATAEPPTPTIVDVSVAGRPARGPEAARVTVVEFTDYQCPFCRRHFSETYQALMRAYEGRVRYVVRNFPIATSHPLAPKAAEAAECAFDQNRFWEYHDALFADPGALDVEGLKRQATRVGLDRERFDQCLDSGVKADTVQQDIADGRRYGVSATPTFFVNGEKVVGAKSLEAFRGLIDEKLR